MKFWKYRWEGNNWPCVEMEPIGTKYFLRVLSFLKVKYNATNAGIIDLIDGYATDLIICDKQAMLHLDTWSLSLAIEDEDLRDKILADLEAVPDQFYEEEA